MKTAKQMADEATGLTPYGGYYFTDEDFKAFCAQLCREQREKCAKQCDSDMLGLTVLNAPPPDGFED